MKSRHRQTQAKNGKKKRESNKNEVDGKALLDEGAEVQSPNRKVIPVESEETQDNAKESFNLSREEAGEISFVPSAISIPQKPMFWCDNRCSHKALRF